MIIQQSEIVVVGGGMIGAAIALGLAKHGFQIIVIERQEPPIIVSTKREPDVRVSAISTNTVNILKMLDVWDMINTVIIHPYRKLEAWELEGINICFDSYELGLPELGFMIENCVLQRVLWDALKKNPKITLFCPSYLKNLYRKQNHWILSIADGKELKTLMVIGADGANSRVRQLVGIGMYSWQYYQSCMLITVKCDDLSNGHTWQHFTPTGPRAFLPLYDNWASLVWYDNTIRIRQLQNMTMSQLQKEISNTFPSKLGNVTPVARDIFSLTWRHVFQYIENGLALVGDAAHTIHPLAGQGVNLGYRDVDSLLQVIIDARVYGEKWYDISILKRYQSHRKRDNLLMQITIDLLYLGFNNNLTLLRMIRNLGLMALQRNNFLKHLILKYALGL